MQTHQSSCIICNGDTVFFFRKKYTTPYDFMLESADFYKCKICGFTFSDTIFNMSDKSWTKLNKEFHNHLEDPSNTININQPPYLEQANLINILSNNNLIDSSNLLDYAGGMGTLSKILNKYFKLDLLIYDPFIKDDLNKELVYLDEENLKPAKTVLNSALFEHIRSREDLEKVNGIVSGDGVLILHTVICENIPKDPNWFYLTPPVHSALHTNKSMEILMSQWGFQSSLYCVAAKSWVLFKNEPEEIFSKIRKINSEFQSNYLLYKNGFMNYWKGF